MKHTEITKVEPVARLKRSQQGERPQRGPLLRLRPTAAATCRTGTGLAFGIQVDVTPTVALFDLLADLIESGGLEG